MSLAAAINCKNSGAMSATASAIPVTIARLVKPRKVPGIVRSPTRSLNVAFTEACNDNMLAVAILSDVLYWTTPDESGKAQTKIRFDGHAWVARSIEFWRIHFGMKSTQKIRTALAVVQASKLVVVVDEQFNGSRWPHYRMSEKGLALVDAYQGGVNSNTPSVASSKGGVKNHMGGVDSNMGGVKSNMTITESYTKEEKDLTSASEKMLATPVQLEALSGQTETSNQPETASPPKAIDSVEKSKSTSALKVVKKDSALAPQEQSSNGTLVWVADWQRLFNDPDDPEPTQLDETERGQLKQLGATSWRDYQTDLREVMRFLKAGTNWIKFLYEVDPVHAKSDSLAHPQVGFLKTHYEVAITLMNKKKMAAAKATAHADQQALLSAMAPVGKKPYQPPKVVEPPMTREEKAAAWVDTLTKMQALLQAKSQAVTA